MHLLIPLKRGLPLFCLPEVLLENTAVSGVCLNISDFMVENVYPQSPKNPEKIFPWIPERLDIHLIFTDLYDIRYEKIPSKTAGLTLMTPRGMKRLTAEIFSSIVQKFKSRLTSVALPCEIIGWSTSSVSKRRMERCAEIASLFADSVKEEIVPYIFPLVGINTAARKELLSGICGRHSGLYLSGFEGSVPCSAMARVQNSVFEELKTQQKSMMACTGSLNEILRSLLAKVNSLVISSPSLLAERGLQIWLELVPRSRELRERLGISSDVPPVDEDEAESRILEMEIEDIWVFLNDQLNLDEGECVLELGDRKYDSDSDCFTNVGTSEFGRRYSRCYVHHLLNCREPLGTQLLEWHNWQTYSLLVDFCGKCVDQPRYLAWVLQANKSRTSHCWDYSLPKTYTIVDNVCADLAVS